MPSRWDTRTSAAEAAAREKSAAEYLRRRLKEAEATFLAKTARRRASLSRQQQQQQHSQSYSTGRRRHGHGHGWRREGRGEDNNSTEESSASGGGGAVGARGGSAGGGGGRWARQRAKRRVEGAPGEAGRGVGAGGDGRRDKEGAAVTSRLRAELESYRKKLAVVTAEASRLREKATGPGPGGGGATRNDRGETEEDGGAGGFKEAGGKRAARPGKACVVCGERRRSRCVPRGSSKL